MSDTLNTDSPCKLICTLDITAGVCSACGRTRDDIAGWTNYSPAQKAFANIEAKKRLKRYEQKDASS